MAKRWVDSGRNHISYRCDDYLHSCIFDQIGISIKIESICAFMKATKTLINSKPVRSFDCIESSPMFLSMRTNSIQWNIFVITCDSLSYINQQKLILALNVFPSLRIYSMVDRIDFVYNLWTDMKTHQHLALLCRLCFISFRVLCDSYACNRNRWLIGNQSVIFIKIWVSWIRVRIQSMIIIIMCWNWKYSIDLNYFATIWTWTA